MAQASLTNPFGTFGLFDIGCQLDAIALGDHHDLSPLAASGRPDRIIPSWPRRTRHVQGFRSIRSGPTRRACGSAAMHPIECPVGRPLDEAKPASRILEEARGAGSSRRLRWEDVYRLYADILKHPEVQLTSALTPRPGQLNRSGAKGELSKTYAAPSISTSASCTSLTGICTGLVS